jgi:hypothetical protein
MKREQLIEAIKAKFPESVGGFWSVEGDYFDSDLSTAITLTLQALSDLGAVMLLPMTDENKDSAGEIYVRARPITDDFAAMANWEGFDDLPDSVQLDGHYAPVFVNALEGEQS